VARDFIGPLIVCVISGSFTEPAVIQSPAMDIHHMKITITGRVQGVSFRRHAKQQADRLGLQGFARNEPDGSVYIEAEGPENKLHEFLRWCKSGSPAAKVESVDSAVHHPLGHEGFETY
jgi:acylphosphatase